MLLKTSFAHVKWLIHGIQRFHSTRANGRVALQFPGQSAQFVGMCQRFAKERWLQSLFDKASELIGFDLLKLCLEGPEKELQRTENCQLAVVMASMAAAEWYCNHGDWKQGEAYPTSSVCAVAGFSVGEFAALVFAKAFSLEDAVKIVHTRAKAMQAASEQYPSGMVTVKGLQDYSINNLCATARTMAHGQDTVNTPVAMVANFLYPKCHVLAGTTDVVNYILQYGKSKHGATDVKQLPVSGAFHTPLMSSAQPILRQALDSVVISLPQIPVYSNVTGKPFQSVNELKELLVDQVVQPVQWNRLIKNIIDDEKPDLFYEAGPGRQLNTMLYHIDSKYKRHCKNIMV